MTLPSPEKNHLSRLIEALARPAAYAQEVDRVEVRQTHISCVFLAGDFAYKIKKPVSLGFLDYSRLEDRLHFCQEELRINRRLAPEVYLGLEWVRARDGDLFFFGEGSPVEVAVKMQRLPDQATFLARVRTGRASALDLEQLADVLVPFYRAANRGPAAAENASAEVVARNARDNFDTLIRFMKGPGEGASLEALLARTEVLLERIRPVVDHRARTVACEAHGDLRLEHVYRLRDGTAGLVVIDAVEFSESLRYADPAADLAFLVMELEREGAAELGRVFIDRYAAVSGDEGVRSVLPFYVAYRALVRAKVEYLKTLEAELPPAEREAAPLRARLHVELARRSLFAGGA